MRRGHHLVCSGGVLRGSKSSAVALRGKIIDLFLCKLRKELADASEGHNFIETVWRRGYVLRESHEEAVRIPA